MSVALMLTACAGDGGGGATDDKTVIGVSLQTMEQQRYAFEAEIMEDVAADNGDEVIINFANSNAATQANQVQSMFQRGIDVLVLQAVDATAGASLVSQAHDLGIEVISYDNLVGGEPDYFITRNGVEAGELQAQSVLDAVPCGEIALIRGDSAIINEREASEGWENVLSEKPDCVEIVYDQNTPGWDTALAQKQSEAALQTNPDITGLLVMWDGGAQGAIPAFKGAGKEPGDIFVTGMDASGPSLTYIAEGWQGSTVWTPIDVMATDAMNVAHAFATDGEAPEADETVDGVPRRYVPLVTVDQSNLCEFINEIAPEGWTTVEQVYGAGTTSCD